MFSGTGLAPGPLPGVVLVSSLGSGSWLHLAGNKTASSDLSDPLRPPAFLGRDLIFATKIHI